MLSSYQQLIEEDQLCETATQTLKRLIDNNLYSYKAVKAYVTLDETFGKTDDKRQLRWAKRYIKNHNIDIDYIKTEIRKDWEEYRKAFEATLKEFDALAPILNLLHLDSKL